MRKNLLTIVLLAAGLLCSTFSWAVTNTCVAKIGETEYTSFTDAYKDALASGGTIVMYADATDMNSTSQIATANITIDLNGKTISGSGYFYPRNKSLTIVDNSAGKTGTINLSNSSYLIYNRGALTIEGGTFKSTSSTSKGIYTNNGTTTLKNGYYSCVIGSYNNSGTININGGLYTQQPTCTYTVPSGYDFVPISETKGGITYTYKVAEVTAETAGASIGSTYYATLDKAYKAAQENNVIELLKDASTSIVLKKNVTYSGLKKTLTTTGIISAGTFNCAVVATAGKIQGGSFINDPSEYVNEELFDVTESESQYVVTLKPEYRAAQIGERYYQTLTDAFADVEAGETITLLKTVSVSSTITTPSKEFTLDLQSYTINGPSSTSTNLFNTYNGSVIFHIKGGADSQINAPGKIRCADGQTIFEETFLGKVNSAFANATSSTLKIKSGYFTADVTSYVDQTASVITNEDPDYPYHVAPLTEENAAVKVTTSDSQTIFYATLAAGITKWKAEDGSTLTLLKDLAAGSTTFLNQAYSYNLTLDLNGHDLNGGGTNVLFDVRGGSFTVKSSVAGGKLSGCSNQLILNGENSTSGTVNIESGILDGSIAPRAINIKGAGSLIINGGTIINTIEYSSPATCTINGGYIAGTIVENTNSPVLLNGGLYTVEPPATCTIGTDKELITLSPAQEIGGITYNYAVVGKAVARIGVTTYTSLQTAFDEMLQGQTVTLLADVEGEFTWKPSNVNAQNLTLDLNGFNITSTTGTALKLGETHGCYLRNYTITNAQDSSTIQGVNKVIELEKGNNAQNVNLTINGKVIVKATANDGYAIFSTASAHTTYRNIVTIAGGKIVGKYNQDIDPNDTNYYCTLYVLTGGNFNFKPEESDIARTSTYASELWLVSSTQYTYGYVLLTPGYNFFEGDEANTWDVSSGVMCNINVGESQHGTVVVKKKNGKEATSVVSGTKVYFVNTPTNGYKLANYVVNGAAVSPSEEITTEYTVNENITVSGNFVALDNVLRNETSGKIYESLVEAVEEAEENDVIIVLKDFSPLASEYKFGFIVGDLYANYMNLVSGKHITIDMAGHTMDMQDYQGYSGYLQLSGHMTFKNGTILSNLNYYHVFVIQYNPTLSTKENSTINFENMTFNGGLQIFQTDATLTNCNVNATIYGNAIITGEPSTVTVNSGNYVGKSSALSVTAPATLALKGGHYSSNPASWVATGYTSEQIGTTGIYRVYKEEGTRPSVTLNNIGTICLPMDVEAGNYEGATFYQIAYREGDVVYFDQVDKLKAGYAYIFCPSATGDITYKMSGAQTTTTTAFNGLYGTLTGINTEKALGENDLTGKYMVSNNIIQKCGNSCWLNANRAYIVWDEIPTTEPAQAPSRRISLSRNGVNTPTDLVEMHNAQCTMQNGKFILNGQFVIVKDGKKFNAQGAAL